jgi:hypothetical protein
LAHAAEQHGHARHLWRLAMWFDAVSAALWLDVISAALWIDAATGAD